MALSIGIRLRDVRRRQRLSQFEVAILAGLRPDRISLLERGVYVMESELVALATALKVSVETLTTSATAGAVPTEERQQPATVPPPIAANDDDETYEEDQP